MSQLAYCNEGCNNQFYVAEFSTNKLPEGIEKTYFTCSHCDHEYVVFYTDKETRELQASMRKLHERFVDPSEDKSKLHKQEKKLRKKIKASMVKVRKREEAKRDK